MQQAENTYVLALDGDVDFQPEALQLLIDRMKINPKVGATCGRIKPGGSGTSSDQTWRFRYKFRSNLEVQVSVRIKPVGSGISSTNEIYTE